MENKTAVEWLAEKYNYVTWMRNRDEISASTADEWRAEFLEQAREMEKEQIMDAYDDGIKAGYGDYIDVQWGRDGKELTAEQYYNETYGNKAADT